MGRRRLLWQLFPSYLVIVAIALGAVTWYVSGELRRFHIEQTRSDLEARAWLVEKQLHGLLGMVPEEAVDALCKELGWRTGTRITVVRPDGLVLGDSVEEPARMDNHAGRPEIVAALQGGVGVSTRYSHTLEQDMMYVAVPVNGQERMRGVVRTALATTAIEKTLHGILLKVSGGGLVVALAAAVLSLSVSRRISRPLEEMKRGAQRFAGGNLEGRLAVQGSEEIEALAVALNQMAAQLDERIRSMVRQRNEQDAVLSSMVEGVLAVDADERVLRINQAAARLLEVQVERAKGRRIQELVRKTELLNFVARTLESREPVEGDIVLGSSEQDQFLQAHGTPLRDPQGHDIGALVVLNDVTRLRRLENVRRDFVANVSHELKTPITAIKGSAETLLDGAIDDPEGGRRFAGIIAKQADRLNAIIDDLLALSRVEQGVEQEGITLRREPVRPVLEAAIQACAMAAQEKAIFLELGCAPDLLAAINAPLLEQAVVNLLTNAVKYSDPKGRVRIEAARLQGRVMLKVQDWGCGIESEHIPRLFERFYRVDKARSRRLGGTGLGLAIVKHIVQAHGGEVVVASTPGKGSTFTIILPAA
ncbi:PAS domain-containing sensor histidine kinase [Desulfuromonas versatilis]|uniref:histidine kinase n=1 Tax=Desulfuromonas versatilis TaxID=2802975 RepID=A0ABM8HWS8_9BACT|nr:ATP-binding protein [Desulfuromonas versatilis]BCR06795.1 PAS domain-containing sensor histidine kinase [Desulfuromonas versatilis]